MVVLHRTAFTSARIWSCRLKTSRGLATAAKEKKEGDISSVFASLSGEAALPLDPRFADIKRRLIGGHEDAIRASWRTLLLVLRDEIKLIAAAGPSVIQEIAFADIDSTSAADSFAHELRKRGAAVIRGVVSQETALGWKEDIRSYLRANPHTKAFPKDDPQVFELYWSPSQIRARSHPNMLKAQRFLMEFWHSKDLHALVDTQNPLSYADRLRIRSPGDAGFALGPHVDGGSVERWEPDGYGKGGVYDKIWQGQWEEYDPFESSVRLDAVINLHEGAGNCSMFRMFQGWLSLSTTSPGEGTLKVYPLLKQATAYYLLRPFFSAKNADATRSGFLDEENWILDVEQTSLIQGAAPGLGQEFNTALHPHLDLERGMTHVPKVYPGDYVAWHCDTIHAVDKTHAGTSDSSVLYIPSSPTTEANLSYVIRQRKAFEAGTPGPDFPGGVGESHHVGRPRKEDIDEAGGERGLYAMGF
ncbi:MAG: hypothetical protein M1818_001503 [Claussenomyces sp. TS43310]|nr:MAG: hypothetical protein M1818_001503 [Claussenomyces sp. TS43310]